jgi:hypothetical protein
MKKKQHEAAMSQADEARMLMRLEILKQYQEALEMHIKEWPHLGDCEWNCTTVGPLHALIAKVRRAALEEAAQACERFFSRSDVWKPSELTAAIRSLAERASKSGWRDEMTKELKIINEYIQMLAAGHVKTGTQEATKEQAEFAISLLQAIAADIEAAGGGP